ncbi:unnamed protein product [Moneuplotes crassus]|uniref:MATE efflux family protein n=2 Tax=Euplotes crassus TaxID=5936 RepID=A0AAD1U815_EUPCR|nr:unnamed protein product [Moneuplotes crassus]
MSDSEIELQSKSKDDLFSGESKNSSSDLNSYIQSVVQQKQVVTYRQGLWNMIKYAIPSTGGLLLNRVVEFTNLVVVGRIGDSTLISGAGLGITTIGIIAFSLGVGLAGGVETLCSQAFGNKKNYLAGCYYTRAQIVLTLVFLFQAVFLLFSTPLLVMLGQPPASAEYAGLYIKILIPGIWFFCQTELLRRFLGAQGAFYIVTNSQIFNCMLHPLWLYLLVFFFDFSVRGVAWATCITYFLNFFVPVMYITFNRKAVKEGCWNWINKDSFVGLFEYLQYGLPAMMMVALEFWAFGVVNLIGGMVGELELAASVIIFNILEFVYMIPAGFGFAASTLVGNNLGDSNPKNARIYVNLSVCISLTCSFILGGGMFLFRHTLAGIFTSDEELGNTIVMALPLVFAMTFGDYLQGICQGCIKAMGKQNFASVICLVGYWIVCIPLTYYMTFSLDLGIRGVWGGLPIGLFIVGTLFVTMICLTDMEKLSEKITSKLETPNDSLLNSSS